MLFRNFERMVDPYPDEPLAKPPGSLWAFIWHYAKPFKWLFLASIVFSAGIALIEVFAFELVGNIVDWATSQGASEFWPHHGWKVLLVCGLIAFVWPIASLIDELILLQGILGNMAMQIRWRGHRYLLRQSNTFFADDFAGRISTKLMQSALGVRDVCVKLSNLFVYMGVYFVATLFLFVGNDWRLAIPLVVWVGLYAVTMKIFLPRQKKWAEQQADARSNLTGRVVDAYTNIHTVKTFGSVKAEEDYTREGMSDMLSKVYGSMRVSTTMSLCLHTLNGFFIASTILLGAIFWSQGQMTIGAFAFASTMALRIQGQATYFLWEAAFLFEHLGAADDGMKTLSRDIAVTDRDEAKELTVSKGEIAFENVRFTYGKDKAVIHDLTLDIAPGERVGLVGRSGAGKSTLVNLLLRLYDVEKGRILIDGQDISDVTQESLRQQIGIVSQDTSLLHRSIRENIAYGRPDAAEEEVIAAAKRAEAWDFIETLEDQKGRMGLEAHVGERGVKLSGGQRQRIAIARVLLKDAPILLLDEATSALDSEVEAAIQSRLDDLMSGKTVLAIAHRLSTIAAMDRLIVLDQGRVIEEGRHEELIEAGGLYAQLWARQSGGFLADQEPAAAE